MIFELNDGWKSLCEFLEVDVPDKPFPHENKGQVITNQLLESHPVLRQAKKEMLVVGCCLSVAFLFGTYMLVRNPSCVKNGAISAMQFTTPLKFW